MVPRRKSFHGGHAKKFTERPTLRSCNDDEEAYFCWTSSYTIDLQSFSAGVGRRVKSWVSHSWCLLILESRLTVLTIVTSCFLNSCCLPFVRFLANSSFFSRTVPQHTGHMTPSISKDLDDLKRCLIDVWAGIQQSLIDDAINQWHKRLCACVRARGGHFEHSLWLSHQSDFANFNLLH